MLIAFGTFAWNATPPSFAQASQDYSSTRIINKAGAAIGLIDIQGAGGDVVAKVYVTGGATSFGPHQEITKGAGFVQAVKDKGFGIMLIFSYKKKGVADEVFDELKLKVDRIEWDDNGKTTAITVADPEVEASFRGKMHIGSNPRGLLHDGLLLLDIDDVGKFSANVRFGGYAGHTPATAETDLTWAACQGDLEAVKTLIARKTPVNASNGRGETALHVSATHGYEGIAALLLTNQAAVNAKNSSGWTPLHNAAVAGRKNIAQMLLAKKADVNAKTNGNDTPLLLAAWKGNKDVVELLLSKGADINAKGGGGRTAIYLAASWGYKDIAELLIANKCDVNAKADDGTTPIGSVPKDHPDIADLLRQHGANE
jgi:hypothetical protein